MDQGAPTSTAELLRRVAGLIGERLPAGWTIRELPRDSRAVDTDASFILSAPDGQTAVIAADVKRIASRGAALSAARSLSTNRESTGDAPMFVARYLAPQTRAMLHESGIGYADATGNVFLSLSAPAIYLADRGADRDPWRGAGRPRGTLKGDPAARVVRALLDADFRWRVRDLITASRASTGATYRVLEYLKENELAVRDADGRWSVPSWERLLRAWAADWNYLSENNVRRFIQPRGLGRVQQSATASALRYAITGAAAAAEWSSVAPQRALSIYAENAQAVADEWGLRETDAGANVVLLEPRMARSIVFENVGRAAGGITRVAAAQAAADLLNGPGRDPAEGEELITWMRANEATWRN